MRPIIPSRTFGKLFPHASSDFPLEELYRLSRLRSTLEAFAVLRVREMPTAAESLARLRGKLDCLREAATQGHHAFHEMDVDFHREMIAASEMPSLLKSWEIVAAELDAYMREMKRLYWPSLLSLYQEHVLLMEAWESPEDWVAEQATLHHVETGWHRMTSLEGGHPEDSNPADRAASFIETHYASSLDIPWVARNVSFVSASHLARLFRQRFGMPPHAWQKKIRLDRAAALLRSVPQEIAAIARQIGYKDTSHFIRDFRRHSGVTPLNYRRLK